MNIFENIKAGEIPNDDIIIDFINNSYTDNKNQEEILQYIKILNQALQNSTNIDEKILLIKILFILENLINNNNILKTTILRFFTIYMENLTSEYINFLDNFLNTIDEKRLFNILKEIIEHDLENLNSTDLRSFLNWTLHRLWTSNKYYVNPIFYTLYDPLKSLILKLRAQNKLADMMYTEFFTYHIIGNLIKTMDEWREFNSNITQQTTLAYKTLIPTLPKINPIQKTKKRIAFIKDRLVFNSPYIIEYSFFKALISNKTFNENYEIIIYSFNQFEKTDDDIEIINELKKLGLTIKNPVNYFKREYGLYNNHLEKALKLRQTLIEDNIDIMIAGGVYPILNLLYMTRTAPLQIYYSHGNCTYDIPNIDKRISHFNQECKDFKWNILDIPISIKFLIGKQQEKQIAKNIKKDYQQKFGKNVIILGTIGRLVKIDNDDYISTIAKIMQKHPNTIYLACGEGNIQNITKKLIKYNIDTKRFIFTGIIQAHIYGWVIDIWPDTFPLRQGQSKNEFLAKGGIVIFMEKYINTTIKNWYKNSSIKVFAKNVNDYIYITSIYITNTKERKKVSNYNKNIFNENIDINHILKVFNV